MTRKAVTKDNLLAEIGAGRPAPVYLIHGPDRYRHEEIIGALCALIPPGLESLSRVMLEGENTSLREAVDLASVPAFGGGPRVVIVRGSPAFPGKSGKKGKGVGEKADPPGDKEALESYLARPFPDSCLVFSQDEPVRSGLSLVKSVAAAGRVVEATTPKKPELASWLRGEAERMGKELSPALAAFLAEQSQANRILLRNELMKAVTHAGEGRAVSRADLAAVTSRSREQRVFDLIDAVAGGKPGSAVVVLRELLRQGEAPLGLLALLANQYRLIWRAAHLAQGSTSDGDIAQRLGAHPFQAKKALRQARKLGRDKAEKALEAMLETDMAIKGGDMPPELALEILCVTLSL